MVPLHCLSRRYRGSLVAAAVFTFSSYLPTQKHSVCGIGGGVFINPPFKCLIPGSGPSIGRQVFGCLCSGLKRWIRQTLAFKTLLFKLLYKLLYCLFILLVKQLSSVEVMCKHTRISCNKMRTATIQQFPNRIMVSYQVTCKSGLQLSFNRIMTTESRKLDWCTFKPLDQNVKACCCSMSFGKAVAWIENCWWNSCYHFSCSGETVIDKWRREKIESHIVFSPLELHQHILHFLSIRWHFCTNSSV